MLSEFLLFSGLLAVSFGLRAVQHPLIFRIGHLGLVATSYLFGYRAGGNHVFGALLASVWLLLPWVDILGRVRHTELPLSRPFSPQPAPSPRRFPQLEELTEEAEKEGFTQVEDFGWRCGEQCHSMRVLALAEKKYQATIHFIESAETEFFYISLISRGDDGSTWTTWNYPFLLTLKPSPGWRLNTRLDAESFLELLAMHEAWVARQPNQKWKAFPTDASEALSLIQNETAALVSHNLQCGVLAHGAEGMVRYTIRGCFYLWFQFLRDLVGAR